MPQNIPLFSFVAFVTVVTPGPTVLLALTNGSRVGLRRALFGVLGAVASDFLLIATVALGLGALFLTSRTLFEVVRWIGVFYLAWLGMRMFLSRSALSSTTVDDRALGPSNFSGKALFLKSFLVAVTNPKGYLFFSALLPQFIVLESARAIQYVSLALVFAFIDFSVMVAYALLGRQATRYLAPKAMRCIERSCGALLVVLSASLALYRR